MGIGGDAPKDFLVYGNPASPSSAFIAKGARVCGNRECATEELISTVGRTLPLAVADSKLVRIKHPVTGRIEVRFLSRFFLHPNEQLLHGAEMLAIYMGASRQEITSTFITVKGKGAARQERQLYTVDLIHDVISAVCQYGECEAVWGGFARMMAYDALIGSRDRHAMNWGVIRNVATPSPVRFAPIFDTARGLFWHHHDANLRANLEPRRATDYVKRYAEKCTPLVGCQRHERGSELNHFEVIEYMLREMPQAYAQGIRSVVFGFRPDDVDRLIRKRFSRIFSDARLTMVSRLLRYRHGRLRILCGG